MRRRAPHTRVPNSICGQSCLAATAQDRPSASRDCPPHTTDLPNSRPIMKIDVRMVDTAPCKNEKMSSKAAPGTKRCQPPYLLTPPCVGITPKTQAILGIRYMRKNVT